MQKKHFVIFVLKDLSLEAYEKSIQVFLQNGAPYKRIRTSLVVLTQLTQQPISLRGFETHFSLAVSCSGSLCSYCGISLLQNLILILNYKFSIKKNLCPEVFINFHPLPIHLFSQSSKVSNLKALLLHPLQLRVQS